MSFSFSTALKEKFPYDGEQFAQIEQFVNDSIAGIKHDKVLVLRERGIYDRFIREIIDFMGNKCCVGIDPESQASFLLHITNENNREFLIEKLKDPQAGNILHNGNHMYEDELNDELNDETSTDDHFKILQLMGGPTITTIYDNREVHISSNLNAPVLHISVFSTGRYARSSAVYDTEFKYRCNCAVPCIITHLNGSCYRDYVYGDSTGGCHFTIMWYNEPRIEFSHYQQKCSNCGQISDRFYMCPHMIHCKACTGKDRILEYNETCAYCYMEDEERCDFPTEPRATQYGMLDAIEGRDTKFKLSCEGHPYNAGLSIGKTLRDILQPDNLAQVVSAIYSTLDPKPTTCPIRTREDTLTPM